MPTRLTLNDFITRAVMVHADKYDYSSAEYVNAYTKIKITCSIHGEFNQRAADHLNGRGCPKCGADAGKCSTDDFVIKSLIVHGYAYDYSLVNYESANSKVKIICPTHGEFLQKPKGHLSGNGCVDCWLESMRFTTSDFIKRSTINHGDKYDYSKVEYVDKHTRVEIVCQEHGSFLQEAGEHMRGAGCPKCARDKCKITTDTFLSRVTEVHGDKYNYSLVNYVNVNTKVEIICQDHGSFFQDAREHYRGSGCPSCSVSGYDKNTPATLYILRSVCGSYFKAGISNNVERRITELRRNTPFDFEPIAKINHNGEVVFGLEKAFHSNFESAQMKGFDGCTEWFKWEASVNDWISLLAR